MTVPTPDLLKLNEILSEQHSMITELFRRLTDNSTADVQSTSQEGMKFLEGSWVSSSGSHGYCQIETQGPRLVYCWAGNDRATGQYYDFRRIGGEIFARFRWFESNICGFVWLKINGPTELSGAWWMEADVPVSARDDPEQLKRARGMNAYVWTKQPATKPPAWATAVFQQPRASAHDERSRLRGSGRNC